MLYLGAILDAFSQYEDLESRRSDARAKSRAKNREGIAG